MTLEQPLATARSQTLADAAEAHLDEVYGYLLYLTRDRETAEDLTGLDVREGAPPLERGSIPRAGPPARGCSGSPERRRSTGSVPSPAVAAARRPLRRPERVDDAFVEGLSPELEEALETLSAGEREVLALRIVLELDGDATARVLGISPTAVSTRLSRALKRLEERVNEG